MQLSEADLQLAYQDTELYRVMRWPLDRALQVPGVRRILERLAMHRQKRLAEGNTRAVQPRLI